MTKEQYLNDRKGLMGEAQALLDSGDADGANAKIDAVSALDEKYESEALAAANLRALQDKTGAQPPAVKNVNIAGIPIAKLGEAGAFDAYDTDEYKRGFMSYVTSGDKSLFNADQVTKTTDAGAVIPSTTLQKIVEKMEATGMILPLVTRTTYKGGVTIPTSSAKPVASWVSEGAGSDKQKKATGTITFAYHKLRCAISVSLEVDVMAYPAFEAAFVNNVAEAMLKAKEEAIVKGDGTGKPKGFLTETPPTGQAIEITETNSFTYETICAAEAALPQAYESEAVWFMSKKTFMHIIALTDQTGQPIARINYGLAGRPERTLLGRTVICNPYMSDWSDSVTADTIIAALFNPKDYLLNTNYQMTVKRYEDNSTDDMVTKAIELVDGKVVDKNSLVTVTVKNS